MISLIYLILLLAFFSVLGLSVASTKMVKERFAILPALGFGAVVGLAYVLSANFRISGALAMTGAVGLLLLLALIRGRTLYQALSAAWQEGEVKRSLFIILIPIFTLLLPALFYGFDFFYGSVNFDFFFNSQESWYLKTHNVLEFDSEGEIIPLTWSSNYQGRFAVSLVAAFFSYWLNADVLQFNSLLLNTLVILFALSMSIFCKELFRFGSKGIMGAVFFAVLSAGFVQSYSYYLLGQLSAIPVFIVYCIFLKSWLDKLNTHHATRLGLSSGALMLALLFNILYILYAILGFFALFLTAVSFCIYSYKQLNKKVILSFIKALFFAGFVFCLIRLTAIAESIAIIDEWVSTSGKVVVGKNAITVFSEYLKDSFLALVFGIVNYPSTVSLFSLFTFLTPVRNYLLFVLGLGALATLFLSLKSYSYAKDISKGAQSIVLALALILLCCAFYFFISMAPYGIFKIQSWFMPLLIPIFFYAFNKKVQIGNKQFHLAILCGSLLALNVGASAVYMADFVVADKFKRYANVRGITGNKDVTGLAAELNGDQVKELSLLLNNGIEAAWVAHFMRDISVKTITHNAQPLADKDLPNEPCSDSQADADRIMGFDSSRFCTQ
jgi:hypothetical protein